MHYDNGDKIYEMGLDMCFERYGLSVNYMEQLAGRLGYTSVFVLHLDY